MLRNGRGEGGRGGGGDTTIKRLVGMSDDLA